MTRVGGNGPEPLPRAPDSVLKPLHPAMAPRPPPRLPGSRPWARPALGTAGVTRAGGPGGGVEGTGGLCGISARLAELGGCAGRGAPGGVELCVYLPSVLVLRGALASPPQQPGPTSPPPPVPQVQCPSSWSLTHRRACPALPSPCSGRITTVISRPVSPTRGDSQGPPCDWKDGRHGHLACSGFARPGGRRPPLPRPGRTWPCSQFLVPELTGLARWVGLLQRSQVLLRRTEAARSKGQSQG